jgi:hypothetical protein
MPKPKILRRKLPYGKNHTTLIRLGTGRNAITISLDYAPVSLRNARIRISLPDTSPASILLSSQPYRNYSGWQKDALIRNGECFVLLRPKHRRKKMTRITMKPKQWVQFLLVGQPRRIAVLQLLQTQHIPIEKWHAARWGGAFALSSYQTQQWLEPNELQLQYAKAVAICSHAHSRRKHSHNFVLNSTDSLSRKDHNHA